MTGYQSKKKAAQDKLDNDDLAIAYMSGYHDGKKAAQPAQEPVAGTKTWFEDGKVVTQYLTAKDIYKEPEQEPVAKYSDIVSDGGLDPRNTTPPQRPWVGLTDDERKGLREWQKIQEELGPVWAPMMLYLYEAIEAKLKEKNT